MKKTLLVLGVSMVLAGCKQNTAPAEKDLLAARIDSLMTSMETHAYSSGLLEKMGQYLDSIDSHRKWITLNLETGIGEEDYVQRMKNLNMYVQKAEWTIGELEKTRSAYASQVRRLKNEVISKNEEILQLQTLVARNQTENEQLQEILKLTEEALIASQSDVGARTATLEAMNMEKQELLKKIQLTESEILYARAEGLEEVARQIKLNPKRKKQTLHEAMKWYSKSLDGGNEKALKKIEGLKKELKIS